MYTALKSLLPKEKIARSNVIYRWLAIFKKGEQCKMSWLNDMSYGVKLHNPQNQCAILKIEKPKIAKNLLSKSILEAVRIFFQLLCFQENTIRKFCPIIVYNENFCILTNVTIQQPNCHRNTNLKMVKLKSLYLLVIDFYAMFHVYYFSYNMHVIHLKKFYTM